MLDLWTQLIELLAKPRFTNGELLMSLIQNLKEKPEINDTDKRVWFYDFPNSGISLDFDSKVGVFTAFTLFVSIEPTESGEVSSGKPYDGDFPYNIFRTDSMEIVESKFPGCTKAVKDYRFDIDLRPLVVTFHFCAVDLKALGESEQRLKLVSVDYEF